MPRVNTQNGFVEIVVDRAPLKVRPGMTVAAVLVGLGRMSFRIDPRTGRARGIYCGIGVCHECLVTVDGRPGVRACQTVVEPGMEVVTGFCPDEPGDGR